MERNQEPGAGGRCEAPTIQMQCINLSPFPFFFELSAAYWLRVQALIDGPVYDRTRQSSETNDRRNTTVAAMHHVRTRHGTQPQRLPSIYDGAKKGVNVCASTSTPPTQQPMFSSLYSY